MKLRSTRLILILLMLFASTVVFACYDETNEYTANVYLTNSQLNPSVAMVKGDGTYAGYFVIAWMSNQQEKPDGTGKYEHDDIFARRFQSDGTPIDANDVLINVTTDGYQQYPSVAINEDGKIIIAWQSGSNKDTGGNIFYRTWWIDDSLGSLGASEVPVRTWANAQGTSVGIDNTGRFAVTWFEGTNFNVKAQPYDSLESPGSLVDVSIVPTIVESNPSISINGDGNFVIAWQKADDYWYDSDKNKWYTDLGIRARVYDWSGSTPTASSVLTVNTILPYDETLPSVAMNDDGNFIITWQRALNKGGGAWDVYARRYNSDTTPVDAVEFFVSNLTDGKQEQPEVDMDSDGYFVVTWQSDAAGDGDNNENGIKAREGFWGAAGTTEDPIFPEDEFLVNTYDKNELYPDVSVHNVDGRCLYIIAWQTNYFENDQSETDTGRSHDIEYKLWSPQQNNAIELEYFKAAAQGADVVLSWKTGTEIDNLGYYLVRSDNFGYTLVNQNIIPAMGSVYSGYSYTFIDNKVAPGREYSYWLVDVNTYGEYTIHGPASVITNLARFDITK